MIALFTKAIVRVPGGNFADGLTSVELGVPEFDKVTAQWIAYCLALESCGLVLTRLEVEPNFPDSTFVEDTAVLTPKGAMLTRPGAASRAGEVAAIADVVRNFYPDMVAIVEPGTLDGGDICEAGEHFFLGLSHRTNEDGARQLAEHLAGEGFTSSTVDIRGMESILHLKSGISFIGDNTLVVMEEMADNPAYKVQFAGYDMIRVIAKESYGANCVRVNGRVLMAAGYPQLVEDLVTRGFHPLVLEMSEFRKMDGGLSCLSLRF